MARRSISMLLAAANLFATQLNAASILGPGNALGETPQMGWNNWNSIACNVDEKVILNNARKLVDLGYAVPDHKMNMSDHLGHYTDSIRPGSETLDTTTS